MQKIFFCDRQQQKYLLNTWWGDTVYEVFLAVEFEIDLLTVRGLSLAKMHKQICLHSFFSYVRIAQMGVTHFLRHSLMIIYSNWQVGM